MWNYFLSSFREKVSVDHLFNLFKGKYKKDIFSYEYLLNILDKTPQVEVIITNPEDFMNYNYFYSLYKTSPSGSLTITNVFTAYTWYENHVLLLLKYHIKFQTRSQHLVRVQNKYYYKSIFNNLKYMDDLKQLTIKCVLQH